MTKHRQKNTFQKLLSFVVGFSLATLFATWFLAIERETADNRAKLREDRARLAKVSYLVSQMPISGTHISLFGPGVGCAVTSVSSGYAWDGVLTFTGGDIFFTFRDGAVAIRHQDGTVHYSGDVNQDDATRHFYDALSRLLRISHSQP